MAKIIFFIISVILFFPSLSLAHGTAHEPFFFINKQPASAFPIEIEDDSTVGFPLPSEEVKTPILVNTPIQFEINTESLESLVPEDKLDDISVLWNFGDGTDSKESAPIHKFKNSGSYITYATVVYKDENQETIKVEESVFITIVPQKTDEAFPKALISVNGKVVKKTTDIQNVSFTYPVTLDGTKSTPNASITEYLWSFGDGKTEKGSVVNHTFKDQFFATVVLRVKDTKGYYSYAAVPLRNDENASNIVRNKTSQQNAGFYAGIILLLLIILTSFIMFKKSIK